MMLVLILERPSPALRGRLTRWLTEVHPGVLVGDVAARVRDELWALIEADTSLDGAAVLVMPARNEQGFTVRSRGDTARSFVDVEGMLLTCRRRRHT